MASPRAAVRLSGLALLALATVGLVRWNPRAVRDPVRRFNKDLLNPLILRYAGHRRFYASVIRHTGRRSGRQYATPVVADPVPGGFVVPLPYGADTDWCRNVLASRRATLECRGTTTEVVDPEVVDGADVLGEVPPPRRWAYRLTGITQYLRLRPRPCSPRPSTHRAG